MSRSPQERRERDSEGEGEEEAVASVRHAVGLGRGTGGPSSSRPRLSAEAVWPEHFVEAVAARVAIDAARNGGRLAAAPAIVAVFQVLSSPAIYLHRDIQVEECIGFYLSHLALLDRSVPVCYRDIRNAN